MSRDVYPSKEDSSLKCGQYLSHPADSEEIVISGIAGSFPSAENVDVFKENLFNKIDMITPSRWDIEHPEVPRRMGLIKKPEKFDAGFFGKEKNEWVAGEFFEVVIFTSGAHMRQVKSMDPMVRIVLEKAVECIMDAGIHPSELANTRTGVFIGACHMETEFSWTWAFPEPNSYIFWGSFKFMLSQRLSYFLRLTGPTIITDTACSSSLYALEHAFRAIRLGECENAIVSGVNICLHPYVSLQFARLGVLSPEGCCRPFDKDGKGYVRSDTVCSIFLQKAKDAKRIYAQIVHVKTGCDGYKEQGITYPSGQDQEQLLREFYEECNISPLSLSFIEAHGTGTVVGDPEECHSIDQVFATNRKESVLIGSVKSSIGHSEAASGLASIVKCIIAMEAGVIPPNINYEAPKESITAIKEGRLEVVTNSMKFRDDRGLIGVNSFGFGGGNCHVLLKIKAKTKANRGVPQDDLPRLVCVSSRTKAGIFLFLDDISRNQINAEYIKLFHDVFSKDIGNHTHRGFGILSKSGEISRSYKLLKTERPILHLVFGKVHNWRLIASDFVEVPLFLMTLKSESVAWRPLDSVVTIMVNLASRRSSPDDAKIVGETAIECIDNIVFSAKWRSLFQCSSQYLRRRIDDILSPKNIHIMKIIKEEDSREPHDILGSVILQICIADIIKALNIECPDATGYSLGELLCGYYNGNRTLEETVNIAFMVENEFYSNTKNIQSRINGNHKINGHNTNIENGGSILQKNNKNVCANGQLKNNLTIVEYFVETLREPNTANCTIHKKSLLWKIGASDLKISTDRDDLEQLIFDGFPNMNHFVQLLQILGRLYLLGHNANISELYPKVDFPVSKGTPMISPKISWNHSRDWFVLKFRPPAIKEQKTFQINISDSTWSFISGHVIDGRNLFPAAGYLFLVWDVFIGIDREYLDVAFENCKFVRATTVPQSGTLELNVMIFRKSGYFEVTEADSPVVTGRIFSVDNVRNEIPNLSRSFAGKEDIPLQSKDIYKELRLRGYNYTGLFKAIKEYKVSEGRGLVKWDDNWITFIDNLFQTKILETDTRLLYVPTSIARLTITASMHKTQIAKYCGNEGSPYLPVQYYPETDIIRAGGIEVRGLTASSINRKKYLGMPVLEKYEFIPNDSNLSLDQYIRVTMQIILENVLFHSLNIAEVIESEVDTNQGILSPIISRVLEDQPLITPNIKILSKTPLKVEVNFPVEDQSLNINDDYTVIVVSNVCSRPQMLNQVLQATTKHGYILARESKCFDISNITGANVTIQTVCRTTTETLILLIKTAESIKRKHIKMNNDNLDWIAEVQKAMTIDQEIVLFMEDEPFGGIIGFVNCLRREPGGEKVKCIFLMDPTQRYNPNDDMYIDQLNKNMAINVFKNGKWGTYRHLLLKNSTEQKTEHCYVNIMVKGDLSSLKWIEGPLNLDHHNASEKQLVEIYYSALNFRDIMTATGKIKADVITTDRIEQECVQGFEFAGRNKDGNRVMGMVNNGALATKVLADYNLLWEVPDSWTLAEAATVPVVYSTVIYALIIRARMERGQSILIHSGTGGIGQAAIRIALHNHCTIFTTVGTEEKKKFLKKMYPQLNERNIGNSHDLSFEQMVMKETGGRGVDIVLNSLAEDKLLASVRCLSRGGKFLEIGKFDISSNNPLSLMLLEREASFYGVMLDKFFTTDPVEKQMLGDYLQKYIHKGAIKPLDKNVFKVDEIEKAFRFMAGGKHQGKVLIEIREEEEENEKIVSPKRQTFSCIPRYSCSSNKSYIIIGGLGGFGLELADWLVLRGAKNVVLTSRSGIQTAYQQMRVRIWKSYGVFVKISTTDVTNRIGCAQLIKEALQLGPVDGIFNLAAVLQDALFENQTIEKFQKSLAPKALITRHIDEITRKMCPDIRDFVVFSSVSCGRGNAGQTNYGMANSIMERICEERRRDGFAALAIEWGAIGEVGLVAEMQENHTELEISGTLQQRISSCLQVLDTFLKQKDATIVSCMVVAEKNSKQKSDSVISYVTNILGINDIKSVSHLSTLAELGMDSMTAVEIKQALEREYEIFLTAQGIRSLTIARLQELEEEKSLGTVKSDIQTSNSEQLPENMIMLDLLSEDVIGMKPLVRMKTKLEENTIAPTVFLIPGLEGFSKIFEPLARQLDGHAVAFQYDYNNPTATIVGLAEEYLKYVKNILGSERKFIIVAHSYGVLVALELSSLLEKEGVFGTCFCIDGSPFLLKAFYRTVDIESKDVFQTSIICNFLAHYAAEYITTKNRDAISRCTNLDEKISIAKELGKDVIPYSNEELKLLAEGIYIRVKLLGQYEPSYLKIYSRIKLCKPTKLSVQNISDDYDLTATCKRPIEIETYEGNHVSVVKNEAIAKEINSYLTRC